MGAGVVIITLDCLFSCNTCEGDTTIGVVAGAGPTKSSKRSYKQSTRGAHFTMPTGRHKLA